MGKQVIKNIPTELTYLGYTGDDFVRCISDCFQMGKHLLSGDFEESKIIRAVESN